MKEFKGMQGPWMASKTDRSIGPVSRDDDQSYGMILPVAWVEFDGNDAYQQANANLIAAAPDLLEALRVLEVSVNNIRYCWEKRPENMWKAIQQAENDCGSARAAISKALGEE